MHGVIIFILKIRLRDGKGVISRNKITDPIRVNKHAKCDGFIKKYL